MIAGLDISINGTGCAFSDGSFHFHTSLKKLPKKIQSEFITGNTAIGFNKNGNAKRYYTNALDIVNKCIEKRVAKVGIENYAYGYGSQSAGRVFDIAEYTGMVKCLLIINNIEIVTFAPTEIKKFAAGKGNASKVLMVEKYFNQFPDSPINYLIDLTKRSKYDSPINDLVDAYFIMKMTMNN